jgi:hypothetical protein
MDWAKFPLADHPPVKTSHPILIVSNTLDPVTPKRSGLIQATNFLNAGFIEQLGEGHCSLSQVSFCTMKLIRAYFSTGELPDSPQIGTDLTGNWTTCEVDIKPWDNLTGETQLNLMSADDQLLVTSAHNLHRALRDHAFGSTYSWDYPSAY